MVDGLDRWSILSESNRIRTLVYLSVHTLDLSCITHFALLVIGIPATCDSSFHHGPLNVGVERSCSGAILCL